jgi:hypothetical protein
LNDLEKDSLPAGNKKEENWHDNVKRKVCKGRGGDTFQPPTNMKCK